MGATSLLKVTFEGLVMGIFAAGSGVRADIPAICPNRLAAVHSCHTPIARVRFMAAPFD
jgi:hypothetical protein